MTIIGSLDFNARTFNFNNIVSSNELITITNNQLTLSYTNNDGNLVQIRKDVNNLMDIEAGDFLSTSDVLDNNNLGGFSKPTKSISRQKYNFGKSLVSVDWTDPDLSTKYNTLNFTDTNNDERICVRIPCIIFQ